MLVRHQTQGKGLGARTMNSNTDAKGSPGSRGSERSSLGRMLGTWLAGAKIVSNLLHP